MLLLICMQYYAGICSFTYLEERLWLLEWPKDTKSDGKEPLLQFLNEQLPLGLCSLDAVVAAFAAELAIFWIWLSNNVHGADPLLLVVTWWRLLEWWWWSTTPAPPEDFPPPPRWNVTLGACWSRAVSDASFEESVEDVLFRWAKNRLFCATLRLVSSSAFCLLNSWTADDRLLLSAAAKDIWRWNMTGNSSEEVIEV